MRAEQTQAGRSLGDHVVRPDLHRTCSEEGQEGWGHRDTGWRATDGWLVRTRAKHTAKSLDYLSEMGEQRLLTWRKSG